MEYLLIGLFIAALGYITSVDTNDTNVRMTRETNQSNQQIQRETNDLQRELAAQSNDWSLQQWHRENEYNLPENQMQRLRDAGINPALAYANGGLMNEAASSPAVNMANVESMRNIAPQIATPTVPDAKTAAEIANINADTNRKNTQNAIDWGNLSNEQKRTIIMQQEADSNSKRVESYCSDIASIIQQRGKDFDLRKEMFEWSKTIDEEHIKQGWQDLGLKEETVRMQAEMLPFMKAKTRAECSKLWNEAKELRARANLINTQEEREGVLKQLDEINLRYQKTLEEARNEVESLVKQGEQERVLAIVDENRAESARARRYEEIYNDDFLFWTYSLVGNGHNVSYFLGSGAKAVDKAGNKPTSVKGFKPTQRKGFFRTFK